LNFSTVDIIEIETLKLLVSILYLNDRANGKSTDKHIKVTVEKF